MRKPDEKFMKRALFLAQSRAQYASPNPRVGALLVKGGRIIGEGATQPYGGPHAEMIALRQAGARARGATLYVTLEPCAHYGKTPPCADAVIAAGVEKVIASLQDPFPLVGGQGFSKLRKAGLEVKVGLLKAEAEQVNEAFFLSVRRRRPKVILKAALSADGKMSPPPGQSRWITGEKARRRAHELRSRVDAILVGSHTARTDNPSLTVRLPGYRRQDGWPLRVVLDSKLRIGLRSNLTRGRAKTVVFTSLAASRTKEKAFERKGILVFRVPLLKKMLSLRAVLKKLHSLQVRTLLVEGGSEVHDSFIREKLLDEVALFISPRILGAGAKAWLDGRGLGGFWGEGRLRNVRLEQVGTDFLLTGQWKA